MNELRWILIGCGALLLLGIFLWGRRVRGQAAVDEVEAESRPDPAIESVPVPVLTPEDRVEPDQPVGNRWQDDGWTSTVTDLPEMRFDTAPAFDDPLEPRLDDELLPPSPDPFVAVPSEDTAPRPAPAPDRAAEPARKQPEKRKIIALRLNAPLTDRYNGQRLRLAFEAARLAHGKYGIFHRQLGDRSVFSVASMVEPGSFDLATMAETQFSGITLFALLPGPAPGGQAFDQLVDCARQLERTLGGELQDERGQPLTVPRTTALRDEVLDFEHLLGRSANESHA